MPLISKKTIFMSKTFTNIITNVIYFKIYHLTQFKIIGKVKQYIENIMKLVLYTFIF